MAAHKIAFYSHLAANAASRGLAAKLGVRPAFELVTFGARDEPAESC